jgi:hypothetical protein
MAKVVQKRLGHSLSELDAQGFGSKRTLRREIEKGNLHAVYISPRVLRVLDDDLQRFLAQRRTTILHHKTAA